MAHSSVRSSLTLLLLLFGSTPVRAQGNPPVGVRAAGMAGAFTAVADDATAPVWNPAGLASGSYVSVAADGSHFDRQSALLVGMATPPLALTYWRTATDELANGRNTFVAHNFGASLVQSIGDTGLAIGTTLKLVRGVVSAENTSTATTKFDADVGIMLSGGLGQVGLSARNLTRPSFAAPEPASAVQLDRQVRAGVALHVNDETTIAADVEFMKAATASGVWRDAAIGIETHPVTMLLLRGGVHWNTAGGVPAEGQEPRGRAPIVAFGMSYAIRSAFWADAQASVGSADGNRGWGVALRYAF